MKIKILIISFLIVGTFINVAAKGVGHAGGRMGRMHGSSFGQINVSHNTGSLGRQSFRRGQGWQAGTFNKQANFRRANQATFANTQVRQPIIRGGQTASRYRGLQTGSNLGTISINRGALAGKAAALNPARGLPQNLRSSKFAAERTTQRMQLQQKFLNKEINGHNGNWWWNNDRKGFFRFVVPAFYNLYGFYPPVWYDFIDVYGFEPNEDNYMDIPEMGIPDTEQQPAISVEDCLRDCTADCLNNSTMSVDQCLGACSKQCNG